MPKLLFEITDPPTKGILKVFDDRIELTKQDPTKFFNNITTKTIPLSSISSVQIKMPSPRLGGFIAFSLSGGREFTGASTLDAVKDENAFLVRNDTYLKATKIKAYIDDFIANKGNSTSVNQISAADEIMKFKALLDQGIITQEEFDSKKKQLLGL